MSFVSVAGTPSAFVYVIRHKALKWALWPDTYISRSETPSDWNLSEVIEIAGGVSLADGSKIHIDGVDPDIEVRPKKPPKSILDWAKAEIKKEATTSELSGKEAYELVLSKATGDAYTGSPTAEEHANTTGHDRRAAALKKRYEQDDLQTMEGVLGLRPALISEENLLSHYLMRCGVSGEIPIIKPGGNYEVLSIQGYGVVDINGVVPSSEQTGLRDSDLGEFIELARHKDTDSFTHSCYRFLADLYSDVMANAESSLQATFTAIPHENFTRDQNIYRAKRQLSLYDEVIEKYTAKLKIEQEDFGTKYQKKYGTHELPIYAIEKLAAVYRRVQDLPLTIMASPKFSIKKCCSLATYYECLKSHLKTQDPPKMPGLESTEAAIEFALDFGDGIYRQMGVAEVMAAAIGRACDGRAVKAIEKRYRLHIVNHGRRFCGKSTLTNGIRDAIVKFGGAVVDVPASATSQFGLEPISIADLGVIDDVTRDTRKIFDNPAIKSILSGDRLSTEEKFKSQKTAQPTVVLWCNNNHWLKYLDSAVQDRLWEVDHDLFGEIATTQLKPYTTLGEYLERKGELYSKQLGISKREGIQTFIEDWVKCCSVMWQARKSETYANELRTHRDKMLTGSPDVKKAKGMDLALDYYHFLLGYAPVLTPRDVLLTCSLISDINRTAYAQLDSNPGTPEQLKWLRFRSLFGIDVNIWHRMGKVLLESRNSYADNAVPDTDRQCLRFLNEFCPDIPESLIGWQLAWADTIQRAQTRNIVPHDFFISREKISQISNEANSNLTGVGAFLTRLNELTLTHQSSLL